jgi:hypothetical protein
MQIDYGTSSFAGADSISFPDWVYTHPETPQSQLHNVVYVAGSESPSPRVAGTADEE